MTPGTILEITLLTDNILATAVAVTEVELLSIDQEHFHTLMLSLPVVRGQRQPLARLPSCVTRRRSPAPLRPASWRSSISTLHTQGLGPAWCECAQGPQAKACAGPDRRGFPWPAAHDIAMNRSRLAPIAPAGVRWLEERARPSNERPRQIFVDV